MKPEIKAQRRLERYLTRVKDLALAGESAAVGQAFCEPLEWPEPQRGYEAVRRVCQLILETGQLLPRQAWVELYAAAADGLADVLERTPAEPVLLNCAGVFLYELTQHDAAAVVFECALALDPSLPAAESNLAGALDSSRRQELLGRPQDRALARRLCEAAAGADPAIGMTLSLCMIVKDEEELLPGCLEAVEAAVDEIIIVDTGSTDRTVEIAESFSARVLHVPWNGSFSDARNAGLDAATGDWVLYLDADEHLVPEDAPRIRELLGRTWREGFFLELTNLTGLEDSGAAVVSPALRVFRNRPEYRFTGRIHEEANGEMPTFLPERFERSDVRVLHLGYLDRLIAQRAKPVRNLTLLKLESDETPSPYVSFNLGSEYLRLAHWSTAAAHLDEAWAAVRDDNWVSIGFAPLLALRTARARRECGRVEDAREVLEHALERLPAYTDLVFELAQCAIETGDLGKAERLLERCLELGDAPAGLVSTVGAGSRLAREQLTRLRQAPDLAHSL
jgi:glycosyltransferase involved in cell wall biosynthesis